MRYLLVGQVLAVSLAVVATGCSDGESGNQALVRVANEDASADCPNGGFRVLTGVDDNGNGTLDDNEVDSSSPSCRGATGPDEAVCNVRRGGSCTNLDLRGAVFGSPDSDATSVNLSEMDFSGSDLRGATFLYTILENANFSGARLDEAYFRSSSIAGANLSGVSAKRVTFDECYMNGANLEDGDFTEARLYVAFSGVKAARAKFVRAFLDSSPPMSGADFTGADFTDCDGVPAALGTNFTNANFTRSALTGFYAGTPEDASNFTGAILDYATLNGANFTLTNIGSVASVTNAYFDGSTMFPADVDFTTRGALNLTVLGTNFAGRDLRFLRSFPDMTGVDLSGANLSGVTSAIAFNNANLTGANLSDGVWSGSNFSGANCTNTNFSNSFMGDVLLSDATVFAGADFSRASLRGLNLGGANMAGANLTNATLFDTDLSGVSGTFTLTNAFVRDATFSGSPTGYLTISTNANLAGADLSGIKLGNDSFTEAATFAGANLTGATLDGTSFLRNDFTNANFTDVTGNYATFSYVNATGANLTNATIRYADIVGLNLTNANLTNANFRCAIAYGAEAPSGAMTTGATFSNTTCPDGSVSDENTPANCDGHQLSEIGANLALVCNET